MTDKYQFMMLTYTNNIYILATLRLAPTTSGKRKKVPIGFAPKKKPACGHWAHTQTLAYTHTSAQHTYIYTFMAEVTAEVHHDSISPVGRDQKIL